MWDWSLGQAGFGEQIQLYTETFWQQVGSTVLWASAVIAVVLLFVALTVLLAGLPEGSQEVRREGRMEKLSGQTPPLSGWTRGDRTERPRPRAA